MTHFKQSGVTFLKKIRRTDNSGGASSVARTAVWGSPTRPLSTGTPAVQGPTAQTQPLCSVSLIACVGTEAMAQGDLHVHKCGGKQHTA